MLYSFTVVVCATWTKIHTRRAKIMMKTHSISRTALICRYAICLALLVVCSQVLIPLPGITPVPVTLAFFMVFVIGGLLGPLHGPLCMLIYMLMGIIGLPVFAGFNSISALVGPTGGYIVGYVPMAAIVGLFVKKSDKPWINMSGMILGMLAGYLCGAVWYMIYASVSFVTSITVTIAPFIIADLLKMILAYLIIRRLKKILA